MTILQTRRTHKTTNPRGMARSLTFWACALALVSLLQISGCQTNDPGAGSTEPLNESEKLDYHRALNRCLKSGGSRIVKVLNQLRCY